MSYRSFYQKLYSDAQLTLRPEDGCTPEQIEEAEERLGVTLPLALRDYYSVAGNHALNQAHNRLLSLSELAFEGDYLIFLEENQCVVSWAIPKALLTRENPVVWQGENGLKILWESDKIELSDFLQIMFYWQAVCGGVDFSGSASDVPQEKRAIIDKHWNLVRSHNAMRFYAKEASVLVLHEAETSLELMACASSLQQFKHLDTLLQIDWDWSVLDELEEETTDDPQGSDELSPQSDVLTGAAARRNLPEA